MEITISHGPKGSSLELGTYHTGCDDRVTLRIETIHHGVEKRELSLNRVTEKVGIHEDVVGRNESCVVLKEHVAGHLRRFSNKLAVDGLFFLLLLSELSLEFVFL